MRAWWLDRLCYHAWRTVHHLEKADRGVSTPFPTDRDREDSDEAVR